MLAGEEQENEAVKDEERIRCLVEQHRRRVAVCNPKAKDKSRVVVTERRGEVGSK